MVNILWILFSVVSKSNNKMKETNNENVLRYDKLIYFHIYYQRKINASRKKKNKTIGL